jgi:hypothetical protein
MSALRIDRRTAALLAAMCATLVVLLGAGASAANAASGRWQLESRPAPTTLNPGAEDQLYVTATDVGDAPIDGTSSKIVVTDTLPKGLKVTAARGRTAYHEFPMACTITPEAGEEPTKVACTLERKLPTYEVLELLYTVQVEASPGTFENKVSVEGGGVAPESISAPVKVGSEKTPFGIDQFELKPENEDGSIDTQAGSHPFALTTKINLNQTIETVPGTGERVASAPALLHDAATKLPPGLVGDANPEAIPQCAEGDFLTILNGKGGGATNACPANTAVGVAVVAVNEPRQFHTVDRVVPVFSLKPAIGEPARFGFEVLKVIVTLDTSVLTGGDYSVVASVRNASEAAQVLGTQVTVWGEPGAEIHDEARGWHCLVDAGNEVTGNPTHEGCAPAERPDKAFLSMPTSCRAPWEGVLLADSWTEQGPREADGQPLEEDPRWHRTTYNLPGKETLKGCGLLPFEPSMTVEPETHSGNTPSGLTVDVHLPQESTLALGGKAVSAIKESTVTLPEGVLLNPAAATGLEACSEGLIGFTGVKEFEPGTPVDTFTSTIPDPEELKPGVNFCPDGSKVGVVHVKTPDLPNELEGGVYLAEQNANPFGSLFAMYIVAQDPVSKVLVKLAGEVSLNPETGQVTTSFKNTPQVPFEDLKLELFGGPRASITTPPLCGSYTTTSSFVPWSGGETKTPSASFNITSGPGGVPCANPLPLNPGFKAGMTNLQAGGFSSFELTLEHHDTDQTPTSLSMKLPKGIAAMLSSVELCPEPQASQGTCGPGSLIGEATAEAGLGSEPFTVTGGKVYITGPYQGAPFGLSVVIPTKAGPFDFGNVVTRSTLNVDPNTAQVTITSELPQFVHTTTTETGVPVSLKVIHVVVNRPNFQFNPTNCTPMNIEGTLSGKQGAAAHLTAPFQADNCKSLPFKPTFEAETTGETSRVIGTNLKVTVRARPGDANIAKTKVIFPEQLPSRLTTIQKACIDAVFEANPASCPEGSVIGRAVAHTPVLKNPLVGPAYLVSHGGAAFPDAEFVLQGEGITLILDGQTNIHNGITSSTFNNVPDAPVSVFEVELPRGPHSAFGNFGSLCEPVHEVTKLVKTTVKSHGHTRHVLKHVTEVKHLEKLILPTILTAQNGDVIEEDTPLSVTACKKAVLGTKTKKKPKKHKKSHGSKKH